jgi:polar amino acid transport system ATP-binding protein
MKTLSIKNLNKSFGTSQILKDISLELNSGTVVSLIGPSGGGKSTLLRIIAGLEAATSGEIQIQGGVGVVFQQFNLFQNLSVLENITLPLIKVRKLSKAKAMALARNCLANVGLVNKENAYPCQLSGGQQQRVAIARTIAFDPQLILFDEPTSSLDPYLKKEVLDLIRSIATDSKRSILLVTHEVEFARAISDSVMRLENCTLINANTEC